MTETLVLPYAPSSAAVARAAVHNALTRQGVVPMRRDDAALVMSELVGNSVRHARARSDGTLLVSMRLTAEEFVVEVTDGGGDEPVMKATPDDAATGRGLVVIDALARRWGTRYDAAGTTVWAVLRLPAGMRRGGVVAAPAAGPDGQVGHPQQR
jgi:anti-sigma regulatory factor (Ser/Thr protein kinase)